MQPLETEATPRSVCAHCGNPLPPPNGSATFVYGVGAVGYQSCDSCGAKWRYLWQNHAPPRLPSDRSRRRAVMLGVGALIVLVVVGGFAFARSQRWNRTDADAAPTTSSVPATGPPSSVGPARLRAAMGEYLALAVSMRSARNEYLDWLRESASATPQYEVNQRTEAYVDGANSAIEQLEAENWPADIEAQIDSLVETARGFVEDLAPVRSGQAGSPAYITMITGEAARVTDAEDAVQQRYLELQPAFRRAAAIPE